MLFNVYIKQLLRVGRDSWMTNRLQIFEKFFSFLVHPFHIIYCRIDDEKNNKVSSYITYILLHITYYLHVCRNFNLILGMKISNSNQKMESADAEIGYSIFVLILLFVYGRRTAKYFFLIDKAVVPKLCATAH